MTTIEQLEALSKVLCVDCSGEGNYSNRGLMEPCKYCHGTGRMFWRLVEQCVNEPSMLGYHPENCFCDGSGYRLIQHDLLEAVMESIKYINEALYFNEILPLCLALVRNNPELTALDAAVAGWYQYALSQGYITEEVG